MVLSLSFPVSVSVDLKEFNNLKFLKVVLLVIVTIVLFDPFLSVSTR